MITSRLFRTSKEKSFRDRTNLKDFCFSHFGGVGTRLSGLFKGTESDLQAAYMKIHPDVYYSMVSFAVLFSLIVPITFSMMYLVGFRVEIPFPSSSGGLMRVPVALFTFVAPLMVLLLGFLMPKVSASNRVSALKVEIPYASMYMSVMSSGGLSPYRSLLRLRNMNLLPNMQKEVTRIFTIVTSLGVDPVTAMEQAAGVVRLREYRDLLLGYASAVRTGGDIVHYMFNQTDLMFKGVSTRIKGVGERMGVLMEAFLSVSILGTIGIFLMFVIGISLPTAGLSLPPELFFIFSYVALPLSCVVFIYAGDAMQISYPVSNYKSYIVFGAFVPVALLLSTQMVIPFFEPSFLVFPPAFELVKFLSKIFGFGTGTEASLGLSLCLMAVAIPGALADYYFVGRERNIQAGITTFLRDLVETRKSGLSPERCIESLSHRDYKAFSKHLRLMSVKIGWGFPVRQIYTDFRAKIHNWLALVNIYLLIDTLEVGGGSERSLETLAGFSENMKQLDDEKRTMLLPLIVVPYMGAAMLTATTVMFLQFFSSLSGLGLTVAQNTLYRILLTPLALHAFMIGLVSGKIISGTVSAGFKHAIILMLVSLAGIWFVANVKMGPMIGGL